MILDDVHLRYGYALCGKGKVKQGLARLARSTSHLLHLKAARQSALLCTQAEQRAILDDIHLRFGYALCGKGEVEEGLAHLALDSRASPVTLLRLFPDLAPQALLEPLLPGENGLFVVNEV